MPGTGHPADSISWLAIGTLVSWLAGALCVGYAFSEKGYRKGVGIALSILISPVVGMLLAIALPDRVLSGATKATPGKPQGLSTVPCPACTAPVVVVMNHNCPFEGPAE